MNVNNLKGISFMIINVFGLAALYATMKFVTASVNSSQAVFFYKSIIFISIIPWVFYGQGLKAIKTPNFKLHLLRSFFSTSGTMTFMYAIKSINLLDITALGHLEQFIWILVGVIFFNESLTKSKIICVVIGFLGGLIIVKPAFFHNLIHSENPIEIPEFNSAYIFVAITIVLWTVNSSLVKVLGQKKASNRAQLFYVMLFAVIFSYFIAFIDWQPLGDLGIKIYPGGIIPFSSINLEMWQVGYISLASLFYLIHNVAFFNSLKYGEMTVIAPFVYFKLIFAGILGFFVFGEKPTIAISYFGYFMIAISGMSFLVAQYRRYKKSKKIVFETEN